MEYFFVGIVSLFFSIAAFGQVDSLGFTNKAEAENKTVKGLKEGKWVDYLDMNYLPTKDTNYVAMYILSVYVSGKVNGISRSYSGDGRLIGEYPHTNGERNGIQKTYYVNGKLCFEIPYKHDEKDGVKKVYYESGKLQAEYHFVNDTFSGLNKGFYESGPLMWEAPFVKGKENGIEKSYYENGKLKCETTYYNGVKVKKKRQKR